MKNIWKQVLFKGFWKFETLNFKNANKKFWGKNFV